MFYYVVNREKSLIFSYQLIEKFVQQTRAYDHAQIHNMYKIVVKEVIAIEHSGEAEQFMGLGYSNNCSALLDSQDFYACLPV